MGVAARTDPGAAIWRNNGVFSAERTQKPLFDGNEPIRLEYGGNSVPCVREIIKSGFLCEITSAQSVNKVCSVHNKVCLVHNNAHSSLAIRVCRGFKDLKNASLDPAKSGKPVYTIKTDTKKNCSSAPWVIAEKKGSFAEEGINAIIWNGSGGGFCQIQQRHYRRSKSAAVC